MKRLLLTIFLLGSHGFAQTSAQIADADVVTNSIERVRAELDRTLLKRDFETADREERMKLTRTASRLASTLGVLLLEQELQTK